MPTETTLEFTADLLIREDSQDIVISRPAGGASRLTRTSEAVRKLLDPLRHGGLQRDALCTVAMYAADGDAGADLARRYRVLGEFARKTFVRYTRVLQGPATAALATSTALATLEPLAPSFRPEEPPADDAFCLSRFASLRRVDDGLVVESARSAMRGCFCRTPGARALVARLATSHSAAQLAVATLDLEESAASALLSLPANAKVAHRRTEDGRIAEDTSVPLGQWEFTICCSTAAAGADVTTTPAPRPGFAALCRRRRPCSRLRRPSGASSMSTNPDGQTPCY